MWLHPLPGLSVVVLFLQVIVIVKWLFQFEVLSWNETGVPEMKPFYPPRFIGIGRNSDYATYELFLLVVMFYHR
jgi:hypothetical protein